MAKITLLAWPLSLFVLAAGCAPGSGEGQESVSCMAGGCEEVPESGGPDAGPASSDVCQNGFDDDDDGQVDEACPCRLGATQPCYPGDPERLGRGLCASGTQTCVETGGGLAWGECEGAVLPSGEACDGLDSDCNGVVDDLASGLACEVEVPFGGAGDCVIVECPPEQPHAIGCEAVMQGGDSRGCAAVMNGDSAVFFKEGDKCGSGSVSGTVLCSVVPGDPLDAASCPMNKPSPRYPSSPYGCPD